MQYTDNYILNLLEYSDVFDIEFINNNFRVIDENLEASVSGAQSDWDQADSTQIDFIKNKPTNLSDFTNDEGFITDQHSHEWVGTSTLKVYPSANEVNFGGTYSGTATTVYFGVTQKDGRILPTAYQFGSDSNPASLIANQMHLKMNDSNHTIRTIASSNSTGTQMNIGDPETNVTLLKGNNVYVYPETAIYLEPYKGANGYIICGSTGTDIQFRPNGDNKHSIGTSSYRFNHMYCVNGVTTTSDIRKKKNISDEFDKLSDVFSKLRPVVYQYNDVDIEQKRIGFVAQEVISAIEECGLDANEFSVIQYDSESDLYGLNYSEFIALNTKMIQNLQNKVKELQDEIAILKDKI